MSKSKKGRLFAGTAAAVAAVAAFGTLGGVSLASSTKKPSEYQYKIDVCHKGKKTISISSRAWPAHARHGDTRGQCPTPAATTHKVKNPTAAAASAGASPHGKAYGHHK